MLEPVAASQPLSHTHNQGTQREHYRPPPAPPSQSKSSIRCTTITHLGMERRRVHGEGGGAGGEGQPRALSFKRTHTHMLRTCPTTGQVAARRASVNAPHRIEVAPSQGWCRRAGTAAWPAWRGRGGGRGRQRLATPDKAALVLFPMSWPAPTLRPGQMMRLSLQSAQSTDRAGPGRSWGPYVAGEGYMAIVCTIFGGRSWAGMLRLSAPARHLGGMLPRRAYSTPASAYAGKPCSHIAPRLG